MGGLICDLEKKKTTVKQHKVVEKSTKIKKLLNRVYVNSQNKTAPYGDVISGQGEQQETMELRENQIWKRG